MTGFAHLLMGVFLLGVAGCVVAIPIVAGKFVGVLLEKDAPQEHKYEGEGEE